MIPGSLNTMMMGGVLPDYLVPNNDPTSAFENIVYTIVWNATRGYHSDTSNWSTVTADVTIPDLSQVDTVTATVYGYYNTPSLCLGNNYILITYDDATTARIGTLDQNATSSSGQTIYRGDLSTLVSVQTNVIGSDYTATTPSDTFISSIELYSNYLAANTIADRGLQDIIATYR